VHPVAWRRWHHAAWLLPPAVTQHSKIIYLYRNPKDTAVSWFHFQRMNKLYQFQGDFATFLDLFLAHDVPYGSWCENIRSWWALRNQPNVLLLSYEDLHTDLPAAVEKVAAFLGRALTPAQVQTVVGHCGFDAMRANPMTNASHMARVEGETEFLRKGQVGDWKNYFSPEQDARIDEWVNEHLGELGIPFVYELVDDAK